MKYLFFLFLILASCNYSAKQKCELDNGRKEFVGLPLDDCEKK